MTVTANQLTVLLFDAPAGGYSELINAYLFANGEVATANALLGSAGITDPSNGVFAYQLAAKLTNGTLPTTGTDSVTSVATLVQGYMAANPTLSRGQVVIDFINALETIPTTDPTYGNARALFDNQVTFADAYTGLSRDIATLQNSIVSVTTDPASIIGAGQTYVLGVSNDLKTLGTGNDTFDGTLASSTSGQTLGNYDTLNGAGGTDTLIATINSASAISPTLTSIENVSAQFTAAGTLSMLNATGVTSIEALNSTAAATFSNIGSASGLTLKVSGTNQNASFGFTTAAVAGTADTVTLDLSAVSTGGTDTITGVETINIVSTGSANVTALSTATATTYNITGDQNLTLGTLADSTVRTVDANAFTGSLSLTMLNTTSNTVTGGAGNDAITGAAGNDVLTGGAGNDTLGGAGGNDILSAGDGNDTITETLGATSVVSINGGAGNDTVTLTTGSSLTSLVTIDGGANTDTISFDNTGAITASMMTNVTGFEKATFTAMNTTQSLAVFGVNNPLTTVTYSGTGATNPTFTNGAATITSLVLSGAAPNNIAFSLATDTSADALTVTLGKTTTNQTTAALTINDDETVTLSSGGSGSAWTNTVTSFAASDLTSLTISGATPLTITNAMTGVTNLATVNASTATGGVSLSATNSTVNLTATGGAGGFTITGGSGNDTLTGSTGNDSLSGGTGNDSIVGGAGNDTLSGGGGNDIISGGDGDDQITVTTGAVSVDGGAGNDTMIFAATLGTTDTVVGGDGNDTVTFTVNSTTGTIAPTLTTVESATIEFGTTTGGAFNASNSTSLTSLTLTATANNGTTATVVNLASGSTVTVGDASVDTVTLDTVAGASLTLKYSATSAVGTTITDVAALTIASGTAAGDATGITVDSVDTTTIAAHATTFSIATGNIATTDAVTSLDISTTTSGATNTVGTVANAEALTSLTVTATNANATVGAVGTAGGTISAENLATVTASASGSATATLGAIVADTDNDNTTDLTMALNLTAATGSTVTVGAIDNQYGKIGMTLSGAGTITVGAITAADLNSIDASNTSGTVTLDMTSTTLGGTVSLGSGTNAYTATKGTDIVTLATLAGTDTINLNAATGTVELVHFQAGTSGDILGVSITHVGAGVDGNHVTLTAGATPTVKVVSAATTAAAGDAVFVLTGAQYGTTALAELAIETGGTRAITFAASLAVDDDVLVMWSDGSNSYLGAYNAASNTVGLSAAGTMTVLAQFDAVDVSVSGTAVTANFDIIA